MTDGTREGIVREWIVVYLKGVFMGAADTVPGISGGTIALITGIYERLVRAVASLDPEPLRRLPRFHDPDERAAFVRALAAMDVGFLVVLGSGIATAVVALSRALALALEHYRAPTNAFFFGLIAASAVVLYREVRLDSPRRIAAAVAGIAVAFFVTGATAGGVLPHSLPVVFLTGAVASSAMLLPGISGAAFLYILGQYEFMIGALHGFIGALSALPTGGSPAAVATSGVVVAVFLAGVAVGVVTVAHAVRWALSADRATTLTVLVSLMVGALRLPVAEVLGHTGRWTATSAAGVVLAALVGGGVVLVLDRYTDDLDY